MTREAWDTRWPPEPGSERDCLASPGRCPHASLVLDPRFLAWEAPRRGRDRGCRRMNWGGVTRFKRELGGARAEVACRLEGGAVWALSNAAAVAWHHARRRPPALAEALKLRKRGGGS